MNNDVRIASIATLKFARKATLGFLESIPEDKLCHQPTPGCNHALWITGHIATTDQYFMQQVGGKSFTELEKWSGWFGMGTKPSANITDYPPAADVKAALHNSRESLLTWLASLDDKTLASPMPESLQSFAPNVATLGCTLAWHEGLHAGQLTMIRKSLGIAPLIG